MFQCTGKLSLYTVHASSLGLFENKFTIVPWWLWQMVGNGSETVSISSQKDLKIRFTGILSLILFRLSSKKHFCWCKLVFLSLIDTQEQDSFGIPYVLFLDIIYLIWILQWNFPSSSSRIRTICLYSWLSVPPVHTMIGLYLLASSNMFRKIRRTPIMPPNLLFIRQS